MNYDALLRPVNRDGWDCLAAVLAPFAVALIGLIVVADALAELFWRWQP